MHGEFLRFLFLQAHQETTTHVNATGLPPQQNQSDNAFQFKDHPILLWPSKQPLMTRTFLKVYMELGSYFLFLQEQIKDIIIIRHCILHGPEKQSRTREG